MKGLISNYLLAALLGMLLSQLAHAEGYFYVNFSRNVTADFSAIYAIGENGTNYFAENNSVVFRSLTDAGKPVIISGGENVVVEMAQISREEIMPNIEWMAANGIITGVEPENYGQISTGIDHMMVFSTDKVELDGPFGRMGRRIAPMEYANGTRLGYLNTVKLPPQGLGGQMLGATAGTPAPSDSSISPQQERKAGAGEESAPAMPFAAPIAQKTTAAGDGAGEEAVISAKEEETQGIGFLPIIGGVLLIAIAAMLLLRQQAVAVQEEAPEVRMALANETRVAIMEDLAEAERIPTDISNRIGKSKATVSEHLEQLVDAGLVEKVQTPGRKFVYYRLSQKGRAVILRRKFAA